MLINATGVYMTAANLGDEEQVLIDVRGVMPRGGMPIRCRRQLDSSGPEHDGNDQNHHARAISIHINLYVVR